MPPQFASRFIGQWIVAFLHGGREMSFRGVFVAVVIAAALVVSAFLVNSRRPLVEVVQPTAALARAVGKCAECHRQETSAVIHEFEMSAHARKGVTCLDCHAPTGN
jgi:hydroxylamine dehydrogenase